MLVQQSNISGRLHGVGSLISKVGVVTDQIRANFSRRKNTEDGYTSQVQKNLRKKSGVLTLFTK